MHRLGSGPLIANLLCCELMTVNDRLRDGDYGTTIVVNRIRYADLANVEAFHSVTFTAEQIADASGNHPDRYIRVAETEAA